MGEIQKVMVCLAFSDFSRGIFNYAANLATNLSAELVMVSVIDERDLDAVSQISSLGYEVDGSHYIEGIRAQREEALTKLIANSDFPGIVPKVVFRLGHPVKELLKAIVKEDVDLVVIGAKGHSNLEHALVGSVAEKVFRRSPATVVCYRDPEHTRKLRKKIRIEKCD